MTTDPDGGMLDRAGAAARLADVGSAQRSSARAAALPWWVLALTACDWGVLVTGVSLLGRTAWAVGLIAASAALTMVTELVRRRRLTAFANLFGHRRTRVAALAVLAVLTAVGLGTAIWAAGAEPAAVAAGGLANTALAMIALMSLNRRLGRSPG